MVSAKELEGVSIEKCHFVGALKNEQFLVSIGKLTPITKSETKI